MAFICFCISPLRLYSNASPVFAWDFRRIQRHVHQMRAFFACVTRMDVTFLYNAVHVGLSTQNIQIISHNVAAPTLTKPRGGVHHKLLMFLTWLGSFTCSCIDTRYKEPRFTVPFDGRKEPRMISPMWPGVNYHSVSITQCFLHCLVNTQKQARHVSLCAPIVKSRFIPSMYCWETLGYGKH
jgi:hypothetical protein